MTGKMVLAVVLALEAVLDAVEHRRRHREKAVPRPAVDDAPDPVVDAPDLLDHHHAAARLALGRARDSAVSSNPSLAVSLMRSPMVILRPLDCSGVMHLCAANG